MEQEEIEERINHIFRNLRFFSLYWKELEKEGKIKSDIIKTIDRLLDQLIDLLKQRK